MSTAVSPRPPSGTHFVQHAKRRGQQERRLVERYHVHGDLIARDELIRRFLPLARQLAVRSSHADSVEDVFQVASVALVKGVDRYDPERGAALSSYLVPTILGELKRHFSDVGWAVHVPRGLQELTLRVRTEVDELSRKRGRSP